MAKASSKKERREASTHPRGTRSSLILKSKINVKENERIARMKAAREAYSKLSQDRSAKQKVDSQVLHGKKDEKHRNKPHSSSSNTSNAAAASFKPMASSLEMIHSGGIRSNIGRASSIAGARSIAPRPSLLPLGINIFEKNVSVIDKMKVRDFVESRLNSGMTPKKTAPLSSGCRSELSSRTQFCIGATIEEQRESLEDGVFVDEHVIRVERDMASLSENTAPHSILKKKKPLLPSTPGEWNGSAAAGEVNLSPDKRVSDFVLSYMKLFNMTDEGWQSIEPMMLDELIGLLKDKKKWLDEQAALMPVDTSSSLLSLPEAVHKPHSRGL